MAELPEEIAMLVGSVNQENANIAQMAESIGSITDPVTGAKLSGNSLGLDKPIGIQDLVVDPDSGMTLPPAEVNGDLPNLPQNYQQQFVPPQPSQQRSMQQNSFSNNQLSGDPIFHPNLQPEILTKLNKIEKIQEKLLEIMVESANVKSHERKETTSK